VDEPAATDAIGVLTSSIVWLACAAAAVTWLVLALATVGGRVGYDRRRHARTAQPRLKLERILGHARAHRNELGKWRRVTALRALGRSEDTAARPVLETALGDADPDVVGAAVRALGEAAATQDWAVEALLRALEQGRGPRSRIAAQVEHLAPRPRSGLLRLLEHSSSEVRFWAVTLLARYGAPEAAAVRARTRDPDPSVRAAAAETLAELGDSAALGAVLRLLDDPEWFVRAHACRAVAALGGLRVAGRLTPLLADDRWWVRAAAKDGLRMLGPDALQALVPLLDSPDRFARNGAAELLQDLGIVDWLTRERPASELLERIFAAGGERLRAAALYRAATPRAEPGEEAKVA
jgi:HEAT repeat protein